MNNIHPLSLEAWAAVSKDLKKAQRRVFDCLAQNDHWMTCQEVAIKLGLESGGISGRFKELQKRGFITEGHIKGRTQGSEILALA